MLRHVGTELRRTASSRDVKQALRQQVMPRYATPAHTAPIVTKTPLLERYSCAGE